MTASGVQRAVRRSSHKFVGIVSILKEYKFNNDYRKWNHCMCRYGPRTKGPNLSISTRRVRVQVAKKLHTWFERILLGSIRSAYDLRVGYNEHGPLTNIRVYKYVVHSNRQLEQRSSGYFCCSRAAFCCSSSFARSFSIRLRSRSVCRLRASCASNSSL